jgi:activator of 2-hydroxyglutaryl-CoA dehydratase
VEVENVIQEINELVNKISRIEEQITDKTKLLKDFFTKASSAMTEKQNYLLTGIQVGSVTKPYLLTSRGIEVVEEEEVIPISTFVDNVIRFANYPNKKIEVLKELATHLEKINQMVDMNCLSSAIP